jgi:hypothetical protein
MDIATGVEGPGEIEGAAGSIAKPQAAQKRPSLEAPHFGQIAIVSPFRSTLFKTMSPRNLPAN